MFAIMNLNNWNAKKVNDALKISCKISFFIDRSNASVTLFGKERSSGEDEVISTERSNRALLQPIKLDQMKMVAQLSPEASVGNKTVLRCDEMAHLRNKNNFEHGRLTTERKHNSSDDELFVPRRKRRLTKKDRDIRKCINRVPELDSDWEKAFVLC